MSRRRGGKDTAATSRSCHRRGRRGREPAPRWFRRWRGNRFFACDVLPCTPALPKFSPLLPGQSLLCRLQDFGKQTIDLGLGGAMIDQTGAQAELATQSRIGKIDSPAFEDALENRFVRSVDVVYAGFAVAKTDRAQTHGRHKLELWIVLDCRGEVLRKTQILFDCFAKSGEAVIAQ